MVLETERLVVRNWQESDVNHYLVLAHDVGYNCFSLPGRFLVHSPEEAHEKVRERMRLFDERKLGKFRFFCEPRANSSAPAGWNLSISRGSLKSS